MPEGYSLTDTSVDGTITTLTNSYTPEETEATVKKVWKDSNNQDGKRPESLTVTLSNGETVTLNAANGWEATVDNLPKYANGQPITYTWTEGEMPEGPRAHLLRCMAEIQPTRRGKKERGAEPVPACSLELKCINIPAYRRD